MRKRFGFPPKGRPWVALSLALLLGVGPVLPMGGSLAVAAPGSEIEFTTLASGQQVYVQEIHAQPIVTIDTWVNTGSAQEVAANNGVSHFLEHLLFKGTHKHKVGEIDRILESRGAEFNAATSKDFTHYHITTASPYFKEALELHAEMLLNATIPEPELDRERKVVQEEINRALDNPARKAYLALSEGLFGQHPYALDTLGPKSNIANLPRKDIMAYYHAWYQPERFKTIVVGDIDTEEAVSQVNEAFQKATAVQVRPEPGQPKTFPVKPLTQPKSIIKADPNLSAIQMEIGFLAPSIAQQADYLALDVATMILGQGQSSRLYQSVKEKRQLVNEISSGNATQQQGGMAYIDAQMKPENREAAKKAILEEVARLNRDGVTPQELAKVKTQVIKDFAFLTESTSGVTGTLGYNVTIGKLEDYTDYVDRVQKITPEMVQAAARKYLDPNKAVMVEILPSSMPQNQAQETAQNIALLKGISSQVASSPQTAVDTSEKKSAIEKVALPNGATLLLKPSSETQTVALHLFAKGGQLLEEKPSVSMLTARLLMKGTENRSAEALAEELEREGLSLSAGSDEDYFQVTGAAVATDLHQLLLILDDVLTHPTFPETELVKERADMLETIRTSRDTPINLMFEKLTAALYPDHPYGEVGERLEADLPKVTQADVKSYYQQQMVPENLVISVVGNFDPAQVKASLQQILSGLPQGKGASVTSFPKVSDLRSPEEVVAQKPEQAATWVAYGWLAPEISTERDYLALKVINTLLGDGLSSRLFVDLREKQGLAYHVSSMFPSKLDKSSFVIYIGTDPKNQEKVQEGFDDEVRQLKTELVPEAELERVKSHLIGSFALGHESNANQAFYLGLYETLGVGYEFDTRFPELIKTITPADVQATAQNIFDQAKIVSIVSPKLVRTEAVSPTGAP